MKRLCGVVVALVCILMVHGDPLQCHHKQCRYISKQNGAYQYKVDNNDITLRVGAYEIVLDCNGADVLQSNALPNADSATFTSVVLINCPLPAGSLANTLTTLNINLDYSGGDWRERRGQLTLTNLPSKTTLSAKHFTGLEKLTALRINTSAKPEHGFLAPLQNLRVLEMSNTMLPDGEMNVPPPTLARVFLKDTGLKQLPSGLRSLNTLQSVEIFSENSLDAVSVPSQALELRLETSATTIGIDSLPTLEKLTIFGWTESRPTLLTRCDALQMLDLENPAMVALPNGWLAKCTNLKNLRIEGASHLTALPPQFVVGANTLMRMQITGGILQTLPADLLDNKPNLGRLELIGNPLKTLPSTLICPLRHVPNVHMPAGTLDKAIQEALVGHQNSDKCGSSASFTRIVFEDYHKGNSAGLRSNLIAMHIWLAPVFIMLFCK